MGDPTSPTSPTSPPGPARTTSNNNNNVEEKKQNKTQHQNAQTAIVLGRYLINIIWTSTWTTYQRARERERELKYNIVFYLQGYWVDWLLW